MTCAICETELELQNLAVFECGHSFHLSCVFTHSFKTTCFTCKQTSLLADLGSDREIAMTAEIDAKIQRRQLKPTKSVTFTQQLASLLSPLTPQARTFLDHVNHNKKLSVIRESGFSPSDAVQQRVKWSKIHSRYNGTEILEFGFRWKHMVEMGIVPAQLSKFTWAQQQHVLELKAPQLLAIRMTVSELCQLKYDTHQLVEMGFDWTVLGRMGTNVDNWKQFRFSLQDIKRNWSPTLSQWVSAGFYDKERLQRAGWPIEDIMETLPTMTERCAGRVLRLAF